MDLAIVNQIRPNTACRSRDINVVSKMQVAGEVQDGFNSPAAELIEKFHGPEDTLAFHK